MTVRYSQLHHQSLGGQPLLKFPLKAVFANRPAAYTADKPGNIAANNKNTDCTHIQGEMAGERCLERHGDTEDLGHAWFPVCALSIADVAIKPHSGAFSIAMARGNKTYVTVRREPEETTRLIRVQLPASEDRRW